METRDVRTQVSCSGRKASGYAIRFNETATISERARQFQETVRPGSLALSPDLRLLWGHDPNNVLGSVSSGTLTVRVDEKGLYFEADLPESAVREAESLSRQDVSGMSFGFTVRENGQTWNKQHRELTGIDIHEISFTAFPAYQGTSASVRSRRQKLELVQRDLI